MKLLNIRVLYLLVFTAILFASCAQDGPFEPRKNPIPTEQITYDPTIWNPNNPYDSVGYYHNEILDYIANNRGELDETDYDSYLESLGDLVSDYLYLNLSETVSSASLISGAEDSFDSFNNVDSLQQWIVQTFPDQEVSGFIHDICLEIRGLEDNVSVLSIIAGIKNIESDVYNSSLTANNKKVVFTFASISRFSLYYWTEVLNDPNSEWREWWSEEHPEEEWENPTVPIYWVSVLADAAAGVTAAIVGDNLLLCAGKAAVGTAGFELAIWEFCGGGLLEGLAALIADFFVVAGDWLF